MAQLVQPQTQARRMAICRECPLLGQYKLVALLGFPDKPKCLLCGCFMDAVPGDLWTGKTYLADQECPIKKWRKIKQKP